MNRDDLSNYLVHWTKGSDEEAFENLLSICFDSFLYGGERGVFGGDKCICFTEAPAEKFHSSVIGQFKPFGIQVTKKWAFKMGGRPVIYQPRSDLHKLDMSIRWRHVDFDICNGSQYRNYTWQREWRIKSDKLELPLPLTVIVPNKQWCNKLIDAFYGENLRRGCEDNMDLGYFYTYRPVLKDEFTVLWLE